MYTQVKLPPLEKGKQESSSFPFPRGGLGWGKTVISQLFQTCVYTVAALAKGGRSTTSSKIQGWVERNMNKD